MGGSGTHMENAEQSNQGDLVTANHDVLPPDSSEAAEPAEAADVPGQQQTTSGDA